MFCEVRNWDLIRISVLTIKSVGPVKVEEFHHKNYEEDLPVNAFKDLSKDWLKRQFSGSGYAKSLSNKGHIAHYQARLKEDILSKFDPIKPEKEFYGLKLPFSHADEGSTEYLKHGEVLVPSATIAKSIQTTWRDWLAHYIYGFIRDEKIPWQNPVKAIIFDQPNSKAVERVEFFDKYLGSMIKQDKIELLNMEGFKHYVDATRDKGALKGFGKRFKSDESIPTDSAFASQVSSPILEPKKKRGLFGR